MSDFMYVMVAGTVILVVGGVLAGFVGDTQAPTPPTATGDSIFFEHLGTIGAIQGTTRDLLRIRDVTVEENSPNKTVIGEDTLELSSSLLNPDSALFEFEAEAPQQLYISFVPQQSAPDEYFNITLNGQAVDTPDLQEGERLTVRTDAVRKGSNVIQFHAKTPGLRFWRTPTFVMRNLNVTLEDLQYSRVVRPFQVYDYEVEGFNEGTLSFSILEDVVRQEPLRIDINGNTVYEGTPVKRALPYERTFFANTTGLHAGENTLSMYTTGPSVYRLASAQLGISFFAGDRQRTVTRGFELSNQQYNRLNDDNVHGQMAYNVERVILQRPVTIEIGNKTETVTPNGGENTVTFDADDVEAGQNQLRFGTDGSYRIAAVNMTLVETEE